MKLIYFLLFLFIFSCQTKKGELNPLKIDLSKSYMSINEQVQKIIEINNGDFPIIIYENSIGNKRLIYLGERHGNDPTNPRFDTILKYFIKLKPQVILNEGGQVNENVYYTNKEEAIKENGTIGYLKFLADKENIQLINADCPDSTEVSYLLKKYDRNKVIYSLVIQRFVPQFISGYEKSTDVITAYQEFTNDYLKKRCHFKLTTQESQWSFFERLYSDYNHKRIDLKNFDFSETESYLSDKGEFGEIGRSSLHIRDSIILTNIYSNLKKYDRVFIVFGGLHLIAEKSTLDKIFEEK